MPKVTLRNLLDHAAEFNYGIPAFNINTMEQGLAVLEAAKETDSPVIIQASRGARAYAGDIMLRALINGLVEQYPQIPICMHQDHGNSLETCRSALDYGFTSVMIDGSLKEDGKTPSDFAYNVEVSARVVKLAHGLGASVEGEIGVIGSLETHGGEQEDGHGAVGKLTKSQLVTDPEQAYEFYKNTHVDALAVAVGTSHGAYKFSRKPDHSILAIDAIQAIHSRLPNVHLVMHGSSSVPKELQDRINRFGGKLKPSWGVPIEEIQRGIQHGVRKINVDTDLRLAMTAAIREVFSLSPEIFDPRTYLKPAREAMKAVCKERYIAFGAAGHGSKVPVHSLETMKARYARTQR